MYVSHLSLEGVNDKLKTRRINGLDALLDDVVSVLILNALEHGLLQLGDNPLLLLQWDALQGLLDHATAVHLEGERLNIRTELEKRS
jgi:hypothetical protein